MKTAFHYLTLSILLLTTLAFAQQASDPSTKELARGFSGEVRGKVEVPFEASVAALRGRYLQACESSLKSLTATGKLDEAIPVMKEIENITKGVEVPFLENREKKTEIDRLRFLWHQEATRLEKERDSRLDTIWLTWEARLSRIEENQTRHSKLDDALSTREQRGQFKRLADLIKSRHASFAVAKSVFDMVRTLTIKMKVDGQDLLKISGGKLWIEHLSWREPQAITVNEEPWNPSWKDKLSSPMSDPKILLVPFAGKPVLLMKDKGRGSVAIVQQPSPDNSQTLIVKFDDGPNGDDSYEAVISW